LNWALRRENFVLDVRIRRGKLSKRVTDEKELKGRDLNQVTSSARERKTPGEKREGRLVPENFGTRGAKREELSCPTKTTGSTSCPAWGRLNERVRGRFRKGGGEGAGRRIRRATPYGERGVKGDYGEKDARGGRRGEAGERILTSNGIVKEQDRAPVQRKRFWDQEGPPEKNRSSNAFGTNRNG